MTGSPRSAAGYEFGPFRLSADGTLLLREGAVVSLAPKVLQTLLVLVEHAGEVVRKADLLQAVWPDSFVEETGLSRNMSLLRQALGDEQQHVIVTVPRVGYRFAAPVRRVDSATGMPPARTPRPRWQPIVGRATQLNALQQALEDARSGRGIVVALAGEPGIGKTTLVDAFLDEVRESCRVGAGRCSERLSGVEPHLPVLEALDELAVDPAVQETLRRRAPTWSRYLASGGQREGADAEAGRPTGGTGSPERLVRELTRFLEDSSRQQPLIIAIDDVQWADVSTVDVLSHLAPRIIQMRVLVLVTYRQHELALPGNPFARLRAELIARGQLREVPVTLLELDDVREYVRAAFGDREFPPELPGFVFRKTEGNPLFITDLVRYVRDSRSDGGRRDNEVPDSLRGLIDRMLQRLPPAAHRLLLLAAVQGYGFDSATLSRVSGSAAAEVEELLRRAEHVHALVTRVRETELPDGTVSVIYRFVHVLYQDALYASITPSRRIEWARQIAEALVASHAGRTGSIAGQLAVLFETGREFWQASLYFVEASRDAMRLFAFGPASELASRGLECLRRVRSGDASDLARRELDLTFAQLVPLASLEGYGAVETERLTSRIVQLADAVGDPVANAAALTATWFVRMARGECRKAREAGERLTAVARVIGDDVLLINGHMNAQLACHHLGQFDQAAVHADAVSALAPRVTLADRCIGILDPIGASIAESSRNRLITGQLARALLECERAVAVGRELAHPDSLAFAWLFHAWIHGYRGDWTTALASVDEGAAVAREAGAVQTLAWNRCVRGWVLAHLGESDAGRDELAAGIDASYTIMGEVSVPQFGAMMAEVLLLRNDVDAAEEWLRRARHVGNANDDKYFTAEVHRLLATCLAARGDGDRARAELHAALDVSRSQGAMFFELRAALTLAGLDPANGCDALCAALARFPEPEPWPEVRAAQRIAGRS
jgi:DNA-binding winged helix-turn-helix (wHTH) protein/tetratricopeptide (TPR) repeat protein